MLGCAAWVGYRGPNIEFGVSNQVNKQQYHHSGSPTGLFIQLEETKQVYLSLFCEP